MKPVSAIIGALLVWMLATFAPATAQPTDAAASHSGWAARDGRRNLAFNLTTISDWSTQVPFIDVARAARPWIGHLPGQWGGRDDAWLREGGFVDDRGWVQSIPTSVTHLSTLVLTDLPAEMTSVAGRYHVQWQGSAYLGFSGRARNVRYQGRNAATFEFEPGPGGISIEFRRGTLTGLSVVHERNLTRFEQGEIFNPDWLARIGDAETLRFMGWMATNNSTLSDWIDRPLVEDATWTGSGVPLEIMLALVNQTGAEPWFTLPHLASDDFVRSFANAVHEGLRPDLRAWFELSNEVWNWSFAQADWAEQNARARWNGRESAWVQFYALRAAQVMGIAADVFADQPARLVRVLGVFTAWLGLEQDILNAPLWQDENPANRPPYESFDVYAVTGYFNADLHAEARLPMVRGWLDESLARAEAEAGEQGLTGEARVSHVARHRFDHAIAMAGQELLDGSVSGDTVGSVRALIDETLAHHAAVAREHGLGLVMYEGGTHVVVSPAQHDEPLLSEFFTALNYSPEMGALYRELIAGWGNLTEAPFNAFEDVSKPTIWGSWGALRHLDDDNPRWQALLEATAR